MDSLAEPQSRQVSDGGAHDVRGAVAELARIEALTESVRAGGNTEAEVELVRLRHKVWQTGQYPDPPRQWDPKPTTPDFVGVTIPEIDSSELTTKVLRSALKQQSCLLVRGLMSAEHADELIAATDQALDALKRRKAGDTDASLRSWFWPFVPEGAQDIFAETRHWATAMGTVFAADSPRNLSRLIDICESMGILELVTEYFGVRPVISVAKTALKRVAPGTPGGWHQDVYGYGEETRALNMWVALSPCGKDAPGLSLVPINPGGLVEDLPPPPPMVPISDATINRLSAERAPLQEPVFEKGDVLFFDTFLPHQTQQGTQFTRDRYAVECWFFSPTTVGGQYIPLHI